MSAALSEIPGAKEYRDHHVHPDDIEFSAESLIEGSSALPKFSVIRDPYEQMRSLFFHVKVREMRQRMRRWMPHPEDFLLFVKNWKGAWWIERLYPYADVSDEIFVYEPDLTMVLHQILQRGNIKQIRVIGTIGRSENVPDNLINDATRAAIDERFPQDIELYRSKLEQRGV